MIFFHKKSEKIASKYRIVKTIEKTHIDPESLSFEYSDTDISILKDDIGQKYLRVYKKNCTSEANGRPITAISDTCYPLEKGEKVTTKNWQKIMLDHYADEIILKQESYCGV
ncbi:hypothetical protein [Butyrivibrio sp. M55]|uniref:hypothetical protein n=1 Tax=Butyrivibrio sp. M55 TaxID=1855323 RepID=UPI0008DF2E2F|nr:hypothetical protein [Butyrivibrio sp. M55]SFU38994.1 hypothetical protein SAMN05216540_101455 [Butyrivibrio sp. M55]